MGDLTALDIIVVLLVGGGAVFGALRGFVCEALSLIAWVLAIFAVKLFHTPVTVFLAEPVGTQAGAAVLAFALVFGATFVAGKFLANSLGSRTRQSVLGPIDRILGVGFGALKGLIGATLLFLLATLVFDTIYGGPAKRPEWIRDSRSYPLLSATSRALVDYIDERRKQIPESAEAKSG